MAATQAEVDALRAAIYSGVKTVAVTFGPRSTTTTYQSLAEMRAALDLAEAELSLTVDAGPSRPRQHLAYQSGNGF